MELSELRTKLLAEGDEVLDLIKRAAEYELAEKSRGIDGWEWFSISADPRTLNKLVTRGLLKIVYKSNKSTYYKLAYDAEDVLNAISTLTPTPAEEKPEIAADLFSDIVGHEDKKEVVMRALRSDQRIHVLLEGSIASAKSLFLQAIMNITGCWYALGSSSSKMGLLEVLVAEKPKYIIIDEIDKSSSEDLSILLSFMETGFVSKTKKTARFALRLDTRVFAACNDAGKLPPELLSRFVRLRFRTYTPEEFKQVVTHVLPKREGKSVEFADYVANALVYYTRDVRDAVKVARLANGNDIDDARRIIELLFVKQGVRDIGYLRY